MLQHNACFIASDLCDIERFNRLGWYWRLSSLCTLLPSQLAIAVPVSSLAGFRSLFQHSHSFYTLKPYPELLLIVLSHFASGVLGSVRPHFLDLVGSEVFFFFCFAVGCLVGV